VTLKQSICPTILSHSILLFVRLIPLSPFFLTLLIHSNVFHFRLTLLSWRWQQPVITCKVLAQQPTDCRALITSCPRHTSRHRVVCSAGWPLIQRSFSCHWLRVPKCEYVHVSSLWVVTYGREALAATGSLCAPWKARIITALYF
jgi:hypothetical protein